MAFKSEQVTLAASTPTPLWQAPGSDASGSPYCPTSKGSNQDPIPVVLICASAIYLGGSDVSASNGFQLAANTPMSFEFWGENEILYAFSTGTPVVQLLFGRQ